MKCDICENREAVLFVQQVMGTTSTEIHLCRECAKKRGIEQSGSGPQLSLTSLFGELLRGQPDEDAKKACGRCGTTVSDFNRHGMIGCSDCYSVFHTEILKYVRSRFPSVEYAGRLPTGLKALRYFVVERQELKERLQKALANEDYETAARLRDELTRVDQGASGEPGVGNAE
jgi:protein arginine kinase activator